MLILISTLQCYSQQKDSLLRIYNNQTIYRYGDYYLKGSERLTFPELQSEFTSDVTKELYKRSKHSLLTSRIFNYVGLALTFVTATLVAANNNTVYELFGATLISGIASSHYRKQSTQFLDRAIWQKNKEILFGNNQ